MFGLKKKKEVTETAAVESISIAEEMGLKEYVSFDSVKAHLVDILEENRKLKQEKEEQRERIYKSQQEHQKQKELALIEADEWKKRAKEKDEEIKRLKTTINEQDKMIEKLEKQNNSLKTEAEMARTEEENTRKRYKEKEDCNIWLKRSLEQKLGCDWDKVTKTQLVDILKTILDENEAQPGA